MTTLGTLTLKEKDEIETTLDKALEPIFLKQVQLLSECRR